MQRLNAIDSIAPAFTRTHEVLFQPFHLGRSWRLAALSYLAYCGSLFLPLPLFFLFIPLGSTPIHSASLAAFTIFASFISALYLALFYCGARMEFVEFEMLVTQTRYIAPMWRRYAARIWPWIGLKVAIGTLLCILFAPLLYASGRQLFTSLPHAEPGHPDPVLFSAMGHILFRFYAVFLSLIVALKLIATLLSDFVLPFYILEDSSILAAIQRGFHILVQDPLQVLLYLVLKPILAVIGFIMQYVAALICFVPVALVAGLIVGVGTVLARNTGAGAHLLFIVAGALIYIGLLLAFLFILIGSYGYLLTLLDAYALFFVGSRYPHLGNLLEPGPDLAFTPPPVFPSPDERDGDDDDGGPSLPMNPAVA